MFLIADSTNELRPGQIGFSNGGSRARLPGRDTCLVFILRGR